MLKSISAGGKKEIERKTVFFGSGGNLLGRKVRLSTDRAVTQESIRRTRQTAVAVLHTIPGEIICSLREYTVHLSALYKGWQTDILLNLFIFV